MKAMLYLMGFTFVSHCLGFDYEPYRAGVFFTTALFIFGYTVAIDKVDEALLVCILALMSMLFL